MGGVGSAKLGGVHTGIARLGDDIMQQCLQ